jgi:two-component system chemotaxis response regulator CheB
MGLTRQYRVLVVEDSEVERRMLIALLATDPDFVLAGWASNGTDAVQAAARLAPDVITMDLRMPLMDGLEATRRIMQTTPRPIVLVTAHAAATDRQFTRDALQAGVLAIVEKPPLGNDHSERATEFLRVVKSMAEIKTVRRWSPERLVPARPVAGPAAPKRFAQTTELIAIGASTGGPQVLLEILSALPAAFPVPVMVVQHIASGFAASLVEWLRPLCEVPVQLAVEGTALDQPGIHIAPTDRHLVVARRRVHLTDDPPLARQRPAATYLFQSVASEYGASAVGVLLSGMGEDGAIGLRDLKRAGGVTIAQDEASSVIFGMPGAAIGLGIVDHILPPDQIASLLIQLGRKAV